LFWKKDLNSLGIFQRGVLLMTVSSLQEFGPKKAPEGAFLLWSQKFALSSMNMKVENFLEYFMWLQLVRRNIYDCFGLFR
ncbi:hypothetical protein RSW31_25630, partial [Escherichia coli]|uniref:hypothetical protein n=1 Tax=Escherichia coli TaxID=562 RepID=UPI0028DE0868